MHKQRINTSFTSNTKKKPSKMGKKSHNAPLQEYMRGLMERSNSSSSVGSFVIVDDNAKQLRSSNHSSHSRSSPASSPEVGGGLSSRRSSEKFSSNGSSNCRSSSSLSLPPPPPPPPPTDICFTPTLSRWAPDTSPSSSNENGGLGTPRRHRYSDCSL